MGQAEDILDRLRDRMRGRTHWEGCRADHIECAAFDEIESLRDRVRELEAKVEMWRDRAADVASDGMLDVWRKEDFGHEAGGDE
jgi:hypothetical protein